jgi:hypothetical protein
MPVQLDQVGTFDLSQVGPGAALVDAEQLIERLECAAVDVKSIRQQLAGRRLPAGLVDGFGIASAEEEVIGLAAGLGIAAEKRPDVALEPERQRRHRRPATKSAQGQVDEQVFGAAPGNRSPFICPCHALDHGERSRERDERLPPKLLLLTPELAFRFFAHWSIVAHRRTQKPDVQYPLYIGFRGYHRAQTRCRSWSQVAARCQIG